MKRNTLILALEGSPLTGKSTLGRRLLTSIKRAVYFPDYVEMLNWQDIPPFDPGSTLAQIAAFKTFMKAESCRASIVHNNPDLKLVILDRSVDTLLAHAWALDEILDYHSYPVCSRLLYDMGYLTPDITILLSADRVTLEHRFAARETDNSCRPFIHEDFLRSCDNYFSESLFRSLRVMPMKSEDVEDLIPLAIADIIRRL